MTIANTQASKTKNIESIKKLESPDAQSNSNVNTNKRIIYPILAECAKLTLDTFWVQVFEECSRGKFPRGSSIDSEGKVVYFRNKGNNNNRNYISYRLKKHPEQNFKDLKRLFQEHLKFKSNQDRLEIRAEFEDICKDLQDSYTGTWKQIKRKKIKDPIIRKYILDLKETYDLDDKETANVAQIIKLGFLFNWINNEDVIYEDKRILDIKTLCFNPKDRVFKLEEPLQQVKREYKPKVNKLANLWDKHLEKPRNQYLL